ncbi:MAG: hypothetical protein AVDCRST_MAG24-900 [uncultured Nocardioidaceae bacterium]|uniref:Esterase-like activity of phytase family protein n=1 Tax=uncultured Nocardioidaceae bacterium TaxID=253824 RepID=A0A6J4LHY7_9ACTN|nr:MAG: hypothetical protein AVDCRST_MAG24-900 [uncultured Nocardioidaceae bacterium]
MSRGGPWPHVGLAAAAVAAAAVLADPAAEVEEAFTLADREIAESSGLVQQDGLVLTVNDSGGDPVIYAVDPESGETVGRTTYTSDEVEDVEAMAVGPDGTVWVGDIGDNGADRDSIALYAVPPVGRGDSTVEAPRYELTYNGGARDAETLLADPRDGRLYVVSKQPFGGAVFAVPDPLQEDGSNVLREVTAVNGFLTDGTFTADGRHALLRGYGRVWLAETDRWRYLANMPLPDQRQGEGITVTDDPETFLISSEGAGTAVLSVPMAEDMAAALRGEDSSEAPPATTEDEEDAGEDEGVPALRVVGVVAGGVVALLALAAAVALLRGARRRGRWRP